MQQMSEENLMDYVGFLTGLQTDILNAAETAKRLIHHAPIDRQELMLMSAQFLTMYAHTVFDAEITLMKTRIIAINSEGEKA